jgi:hypothetical protein
MQTFLRIRLHDLARWAADEAAARERAARLERFTQRKHRVAD